MASDAGPVKGTGVIYANSCTNVWMCMYLCVSIDLFVYLYTRAKIYIYIYMYMKTPICIYIQLHMYMIHTTDKGLHISIWIYAIPIHPSIAKGLHNHICLRSVCPREHLSRMQEPEPAVTGFIKHT